MPKITHEMRYEAGSSRYRILSLYVQDPKAEKEGFTIRTGQAPKGHMDTERFLKMFGIQVDLFASLGHEKWRYNLTKEEARLIVQRWRKTCDKTGLIKVLSFDGEYKEIKHE